MSRNPRYSTAFKEQALSKMLSRGNRTIASVAEELNVNIFTVKNWMKTVVQKEPKVALQKESPP